MKSKFHIALTLTSSSYLFVNLQIEDWIADAQKTYLENLIAHLKKVEIAKFSQFPSAPEKKTDNILIPQSAFFDFCIHRIFTKVYQAALHAGRPKYVLHEIRKIPWCAEKIYYVVVNQSQKILWIVAVFDCIEVWFTE